jgi:putative transposase
VPNRVWSTDATEGWTALGGRCAVFAIVDHASGEAWGDAAAPLGRSAAADLLREIATERFGSVERAVAAGLELRYEGGTCFRSVHCQDEIAEVGIALSPGFHYESDANGAGQFIQILKERVLRIERFETLEELRSAIRAFAAVFNREWLLERHSYRTPIAARDHLIGQAAHQQVHE